jgi:GDP-4-dehydro-6-deoxy-D-mannose reductase
LKDVLRQETTGEPLRAFVTGIAGFAGTHLAELLIKEGFKTYGTDLGERSLARAAEIVKGAELARCDVRDGETLSRIVSEVAPDIVFHLAAMASVLDCERNPTVAIETNVIGSSNLLDAVRNNAPNARTVVVSSSEVYGKVAPEQIPLAENAPVRPANLYGVTKASVEMLSTLYVQKYGMDIVILRPFNHVGPRQNPAFVCSDFAAQRMDVGDLSVQRDFTDVKDMVRGYVVAARRARGGEIYNVCSGRSIRIEQVLHMVLGYAEVAIEVHRDPAKFRPSELPVLVGSSEKFAGATGWAADIPIEATLRDTLDYWRAEIASSSRAEDLTRAT